MTRLENWPQILSDFIDSADRPFCWGSWDCGLLAADCVLAMTGIDLAAEGRGRYTTALGARRVMRGSMAEMMARVSKAHGMTEIKPTMAQRGDMVMVETQLGDALGICVGARVACAGPDGLTYMPISSARCAWKV